MRSSVSIAADAGTLRTPQGAAIYRAIVASIAVVAALPIAVAALSVFADTGDVWSHLSTYVLPTALANTLWLVIGVAVLTGVLGVALAWTVAVYEFPGRRFFNWALLLPMAIPGYVLAFAFAALFEYTGAIQTFWRDVAGSPFAFPDVGAAGASILTLSLVLYPYVFLVVREAFSSQGIRGLEVAQSCGLTPWQGFFRVSLPMARPFIAGGVSLAVMECLADFGTVKLYNYSTFTTAIYQAWYGLFSLQSALQLSLVLIVLVAFALLLERGLRGKSRYTSTGTPAHRERITLSGGSRFLAAALCSTVFVIAFVVPAALIFSWSVASFTQEFDVRYWQFAANSLLLSLMAAALIGGVAILLSYSVRRQPGTVTYLMSRLATMGYAIPGTVLAVGFFVPVAGLSRLANRIFATADGTTVALHGGLLVILLAYMSRYLAVAHSPVDAAMQRIGPSIEDASRSLGVSGLAMLRKVHLPILRPAILTAMLLVFVDVMKELPITLMTRPFGWDTLAVRVFQLTTEGEWERAALPALLILLVGLLPVLLLTRQRNDA